MSTFDRLLALSALQKSGDSAYEDSELRQMIEELQNNEIKHINQDGALTWEELIALPTGFYIFDNGFSWSNDSADINIQIEDIVGVQPNCIMMLASKIVYWWRPSEDGYIITPVYCTDRTLVYKDFTMAEFNDWFKGKLYEEIGGKGIPHVNQDGALTWEELIALPTGFYICDQYFHWNNNQVDINIEAGQLIGIQPNQLIRLSTGTIYWFWPIEDGYNVSYVQFADRTLVYKDSHMAEFNDWFKGKLYEEIGGKGIPHVNQDGTMTIDDLVARGDGVYYIDNEISVEFEEANGNIGSVYIVGLTTVAYEGKNIYCIPLEGTLFLSERLNPETGEPTGETYWTFENFILLSEYNELDARLTALESIGNAEEGAY